MEMEMELELEKDKDQVIKNEVALWALNHLKKLAQREFADTDPIMPPGNLPAPIIMGRDNSVPRFKAVAEAVEVAGRLELTARAYRDPLSKLPSDGEAVEYATHAAAMIAQEAEPVRCDALTKAVNAVCTCGGGPPGECCQACAVLHLVKGTTDEPEEAVEEVPK